MSPWGGPYLAIVWSGHLRAVVLWAEPGPRGHQEVLVLTYPSLVLIYTSLGLQVV